MKKLSSCSPWPYLPRAVPARTAQEQSKAAVEQRDLLETQRKSEEEAKRAQIAREQEELKRQLEEQKQRQQRGDDRRGQAPARSVRGRAPPGRRPQPAQGSGEPAVQAQRLLRLRQLQHQGGVPRVVEAHAKFCSTTRPQSARRGQLRRARQPRVQPGARPAPRRRRQARADAAGRAGEPDRNRELRRGEARSLGQDEEAWAENRRSDMSIRASSELGAAASATHEAMLLAIVVLALAAGSPSAPRRRRRPRSPRRPPIRARTACCSIC